MATTADSLAVLAAITMATTVDAVKTVAKLLSGYFFCPASVAVATTMADSSANQIIIKNRLCKEPIFSW